MNQPFDIDAWAAKGVREMLERVRRWALLELQRELMDSTEWLRESR